MGLMSMSGKETKWAILWSKSGLAFWLVKERILDSDSKDSFHLSFFRKDSWVRVRKIWDSNPYSDSNPSNPLGQGSATYGSPARCGSFDGCICLKKYVKNMALSAKKVADLCFRLFQKQATANPNPWSGGKKESRVRVRKIPDSFLH